MARRDSDDAILQALANPVDAAEHAARVRHTSPVPNFSSGPLLAAEAAVREAIALLQHAQTTEWKSIAADVCRLELYEAISILRAIDDAIDEARHRVTTLQRARPAVVSW